MKNNIVQALKDVREKSPLVHQITNYVTVNDCANITLAIGASPVMADDINEVEDMVSIASALVINIGTLNSNTVKSMIAAGKKANELGVPVVLDPVGVGATPFRNKVGAELIKEVKFSVIRGNLSEIKSLYGADVKTKGVDSLEESSLNEVGLAKEIAKRWGTVIAITGAKDIITDGERVAVVENGHKIMSKVTGTGCMCTALTGAFAGVCEDAFTAALAGVVSMGIAGEKANERLVENEGTGKLRLNIIDEIYNLSPEVILERGRVDEK